ncbi:MAG: von Willebrand factor type A domain-containing protein [Bradymonadaceae bacterium]|nr:von Willebrand factor type A domain-containing protein [Lujinxingiaceae bacterium]
MSDSKNALSVSGIGSGEGGLSLSGSGRGGGGGGIGVSYGRGAGVGTSGLGGIGYSGKGTGAKIGRGAYARQSGFVEPQRQSEGYRDYGINRWTNAADDRFSTFAIDVDTGSYTLARRKLEGGELPLPEAVRVEEFMNYFRYSYSEPIDGPFAVHLEAAPNPFSAEPERVLLRVGLQARSLAGAERKPVHLTFLVDVSGSMNRADRLPLVKRTLEVLTNNLRAGDTVALATYAGRVAKILDPTGVEQKGRILEAIEALNAGGSTAMSSGIDLAYELAHKNFKPGEVNRVIILSDGDANVGRTSHEAILDQIAGHVKRGITLSTVGFGVGNYQDVMMEQLANRGNGNYHYVDRLEEAHRIFGDQLGGTLEVIAKDVKIQVDFHPEAVKRYRLIGYENRDIADKDFRNDSVDAGEIGVGHTVTALFEVELDERADTSAIATLRVRHKAPDGEVAREAAFALERSQIKLNIDAASTDFSFVAAVATFAELLRESPHVVGLNPAQVEALASKSAGSSPDRREFLRLVGLARPMLEARFNTVR